MKHVAGALRRPLAPMMIALCALAGCADELPPEAQAGAASGVERASLDDAWPGRDPKSDTTCHARAAWCPARDLTPWSPLADQAVSIRFSLGDVEKETVVTAEETETHTEGNTTEITTRISTTTETSSFSLIKEFAPYYVEVDGPGVLEVEITPASEGDEASWLILTPEMEKFTRFDGLKASVETEQGGLVKVAVLPESAEAESVGEAVVATMRYEIEARWYPTSPSGEAPAGE